MKQLYKIQYTRTITSSPEYAEITANSREEARDIFYGMNPTFFVTSVYLYEFENMKEEVTVNIPINDYNELVNFKKEIERDNTFYVDTNLSPFMGEFITKDESLKILIESNKRLENTCIRLGFEFYKLVGDLQNMSCRDFRKWKETPLDDLVEKITKL